MEQAVCIECNQEITIEERDYSVERFFGYAVCRADQKIIKKKKTQDEVLKLYFALRKRGVPCELEYSDGHKKVDIAVIEAKVYIEVDGSQHWTDAKQAFTDIQRTYYSFVNGFITLHVPNNLVNNKMIDEAANWLTEIIKESKPRKGWGKY